jgi:hypothetical protein
MTDNLTIQLFKSFQEEVQDTTHKEEVPSQSELQDNELKSNESSDFLFDASCSNCLKEFTTSSLKANLLDQICGECNENFKNSLQKGTGTLIIL